MATAVLLLTCADRPGIVPPSPISSCATAATSSTPSSTPTGARPCFFQRVEFELDGFGLARDEIEAAFAPLARGFAMQSQLTFSDARPRVALFVFRQGHCLYDRLARWRMGELPVDVAMVVSNHLAQLPSRFCVFPSSGVAARSGVGAAGVGSP